jgi:hypothetical protein
MSVVHQGRTSSPIGPAVRQRALLRRLMIVCPETFRATDTGFELTAIPRLSARRQLLVDCLECGQDHEWQVEDSFLD